MIAAFGVAKLQREMDRMGVEVERHGDSTGWLTGLSVGDQTASLLFSE
jgi:hypothetical protein